jgi:hypothetical protein
MIIVNFTHPLTDAQLAQIAALTKAEPARVIQAMAQFDDQQPYAAQAADLVAQVDLSPDEWQTTPILVVPPALNFIAVLVLAELHGRMGYFPATVRLRPVPDAVPRRYEVAEILDLQGVRDAARYARKA